jgi:hypothetical protein
MDRKPHDGQEGMKYWCEIGWKIRQERLQDRQEAHRLKEGAARWEGSPKTSRRGWEMGRKGCKRGKKANDWQGGLEDGQERLEDGQEARRLAAGAGSWARKAARWAESTKTDRRD